MTGKIWNQTPLPIKSRFCLIMQKTWVSVRGILYRRWNFRDNFSKTGLSADAENGGKWKGRDYYRKGCFFGREQVKMCTLTQMIYLCLDVTFIAIQENIHSTTGEAMLPFYNIFNEWVVCGCRRARKSVQSLIWKSHRADGFLLPLPMNTRR